MILDELISVGFSFVQAPTVHVVEPDRVENFGDQRARDSALRAVQVRRARLSQTLQGETKVVPFTVLSNSAPSDAKPPWFYLFNFVIFVPCSPRPAIRPF